MTDSEQAMKDGYTVDRHCYPWVAYKGPRFNPTEWKHIRTDCECIAVDALNNYERVQKNIINSQVAGMARIHSGDD
jgi:hypothetical protein